LIAEDNVDNLGLLMDYLSTKGFALVAAANGTQAVELAVTERPDIIVMDIQMPDMDGLEAIKRIRCEHALAGTPIIALTALAMIGDRERCLEAGATDYVSKPVSMRQLTQLLRSYL
jgi:CheY-like chemotaxis protein